MCGVCSTTILKCKGVYVKMSYKWFSDDLMYHAMDYINYCLDHEYCPTLKGFVNWLKENTTMEQSKNE